MKFLLVFSLLYFSKGEEEEHKKMNVGTVLFTESDNSKDCWGSENIALLTSRMMLEDLLPAEKVLVIKDGAFVTDIIDYFRLVLEVVRKLTFGKTKHIMLLALTDTLGGYLNSYVIPTAKHAYYAGYIDFDSMDRLYQLFDELKCFLRTNGNGWAHPIKNAGSKIKAQVLPIQAPPPRTDPCKGLIIFDKPHQSRGGRNTCPIGIPMPFFDSKTHPSSIAIPFRTYSLRNLESKSASFVLVKFYMAATKCLAAKNADQGSMSDFNMNFYSWMHTQVTPHLNDEKFYSAFGGILRIEATLNKLGTQTLGGGREMGHYNVMPEQQMGKEAIDDASSAKHKKRNFILIALLVVIFIWFCLGSIFICYRIRSSKERKRDKETSSTSSRGTSKKSTKTLSSLTSSKKRSTTTDTTGRSTQKDTTFSSGNATPPQGTYPSTGSEGEESAASQQSAKLSGGSKHSSTPISRSSRTTSPRGSIASQGSQISKKTASTKKTGRSILPKKGLKPMYPASCACHTSMTGKYRMTSSSEEQMKKKEKDEPLVFGYELETSSDSTGGDPNYDVHLDSPVLHK